MTLFPSNRAGRLRPAQLTLRDYGLLRRQSPPGRAERERARRVLIQSLGILPLASAEVLFSPFGFQRNLSLPEILVFKASICSKIYVLLFPVGFKSIMLPRDLSKWRYSDFAHSLPRAEVWLCVPILKNPPVGWIVATQGSIPFQDYISSLVAFVRRTLSAFYSGLVSGF